MSATGAAVESATPATAADPGAVDTDASSDAGDASYESAAEQSLGSLEQLWDALDLSPEERAERVAERARGEDGRFVAGDKDKPADAADAKAKPDAADDDDATIKAINARSRARRLARQQARPAPVAAAPVQAPPPAAKVEAPKAAAPTTGVEAAVKDVLAQISRLAGEDEAAAAGTTGAQPDRAADVASIQAKLDAIAEATKKSDAHDEDLKNLRAQLKGIESEKRVRDHLESEFDKIAHIAPTLASKRNLGDLLYRGADKFFTKFGKFPDVKALAERIETKLKASAPEKTATGTPAETKPPTRNKTVSSSLGSPPAERTGPDDRTAEQAERDFRARLGLDD